MNAGGTISRKRNSIRIVVTRERNTANAVKIVLSGQQFVIGKNAKGGKRRMIIKGLIAMLIVLFLSVLFFKGAKEEK